MPLSAEFIRRLDELREECFATQADGVTRYTFLLSEEQVLDLASGYVPDAVKAMCLTSLDWRREDQRRANRPVKAKTKKNLARVDRPGVD